MSVNEPSHPADAAAAPLIDADAPPTAAEELQAEAEQLRAQVTELKNEVLRGRADMENQRKRAERDVEAAHKYGLERFVHDLLPVKDSLDLGLNAALSATEIDKIREGMALTIKMLDDFFTKLNIEQIEPIGERFDPELHQAMTMEASVDVPPGTVTRVMQSGYRLNQRLLRPALVVVAKEAAEGAA